MKMFFMIMICFLVMKKEMVLGQMLILWNQRRKGICDKHLRKLQTIYSVAVEALPCSFGLRKRL